jgi:F-type H+-transporting ATPase subunit gamma
VHPLLVKRPGAETGPTLLIVMTSDRGLCGSFNTNVVKAVSAFLRENPGRQITLVLVGRKGRDLLGRRGLPVLFDYVNLPNVIRVAEAEAIVAPVVEAYLEGKFDSVHMVYNEFKSVIQQQVVVEQVLPLSPIEAEDASAPQTDYLYEPGPEQIFDRVLRRFVDAQVLRALLESAAAEQAARMTAMDAATRNSAEMIEGLTLTMNKVRQAAITREIIEVVSGAQALK